MSNYGSALVWVDAEAGGGRVEIYSREVRKADALRMFAAVRGDPRSFQEGDDLAACVATEVIGDALYAGYFCSRSKGLDEWHEVAFALPHACEAISKHFGIDAGILEHALRPENLAELAAARDAEISRTYERRRGRARKACVGASGPGRRTGEGHRRRKNRLPLSIQDASGAALTMLSRRYPR